MESEMDTAEIQSRLDALVPAMIAKGFRQPETVVNIRSQGQIAVRGSWKDEKNTYGESFQYKHADTAEEAFALFEAWVASQPDAKERRLNEFLSAVGAAADLGRELGIDAEFVNPMLVTMKSLSENALTYQGAAE
jgi:hypothetical protein